MAEISATGYRMEKCDQYIKVLIPEAIKLDPRADGRAMIVKDAADKIATINAEIAVARQNIQYLEERRAKILEEAI